MNNLGKIKLKIGEKYKIQLYPEKTIVNAKYEGVFDKNHIFSFEWGGENMCTLLDDKLITQGEDKIITYKNSSPFVIELLNAETLELMPSGEEKSKLYNLLNLAEVKL